MGRVYDVLGQKDKALDFFQQALAIRREVGNRSGEGTTLMNIGTVYVALGQNQLALEYFQQALPILRETGFRYMEGLTLWNMGDLFERMNRWKKPKRFCSWPSSR